MYNLVVPSVWGAVVWIVSFVSCLVFAPEVEVSVDATFLVAYLVLCYLFSFLLFRNKFRKILYSGSFDFHEKQIKAWFVGCTVIGWLGLLLYINDFSFYLGGLSSFSDAVVNDPLILRALAEQETSLGFQLSYFSWLSFFIGSVLLVFVRLNSGQKVAIVIILILTYLGNILFVDRTRPTILILVASFIVFYARLHFHKKVLRLMMIIVALPFVVFFVQVIFSGKYYVEDGLIKTLIVYMFGGFGYLSSLLNDDVVGVTFVRTFYPVAKLLTVFGFDIDVPSQILEFRYIPFPTNVGTFFEPMLSDAGLTFALFFAPLLILSMDLVAFFFLARRVVFGLILWANFIVINLFGFFSPKYNNTYIYLLIVCAILFYLSGKITFGARKL